MQVSPCKLERVFAIGLPTAQLWQLCTLGIATAAVTDAAMLDFGPDVTVEQDEEMMKKCDEQNARAQAQRDEEKRKFEDKIFIGSRTEQAKQYANSLFKEGKMKDAGAAYERLLPLITDDDDMTAAVRSNLSAVRIREWKWKEALAEVERVLKLRPGHAKALYRRAQAFRGLRELDMALEVIEESRKNTDEGNKPALTELDNLKNSIIKEKERNKREEKERKEARERKDRRLKELAKKNAHKMDVRRDANGIKLPPAEEGEEATGAVHLDHNGMPSASASVARASGNWAGWWFNEITKIFTDEDARMMLYDEDGWIETTEVPETKAEVYAQVRVNEDGTRTLTYETSLNLNCMVAQFRGPEGEGATSVHLQVLVRNVDNATTPEQWSIVADYGRPSNYQPSERIKKLMETYVKPKFVPFVREQIQAIVRTLVCKCTGKAAFKMITDERAEAKAKKAAERKEQEANQAQMAERMKKALDMADKEFEESEAKAKSDKALTDKNEEAVSVS